MHTGSQVAEFESSERGLNQAGPDSKAELLMMEVPCVFVSTNTTATGVSAQSKNGEKAKSRRTGRDAILEDEYRLSGIDVDISTSSQGQPLAFSSLGSIGNMDASASSFWGPISDVSASTSLSINERNELVKVARSDIELEGTTSQIPFNQHSEKISGHTDHISRTTCDGIIENQEKEPGLHTKPDGDLGIVQKPEISPSAYGEPSLEFTLPTAKSDPYAASSGEAYRKIKRAFGSSHHTPSFRPPANSRPGSALPWSDHQRRLSYGNKVHTRQSSLASSAHRKSSQLRPHWRPPGVVY
ncbi:MAG: hypothetical protein M1821_005820 [Bathelium mastoideum]|nr:MAG: hypothetical protein M1821_005820 [Bathelium mastoideum]